MRVVVLAIGLAMAAAPAWAAETAAETPAATKTDPDADKIICKERMRANSRFVTRQCLTKAEWEDQANTASKAFSEVQNRPMVFIGKGN